MGYLLHRTEYDGYLEPLLKMLSDGADAQNVARYLASVQTEQMDLPATPEEQREVANRIIDWYVIRGHG